MFRRERRQREMFILPVQPTTCRTGISLTRLMHTLAICVTIRNTYISLVPPWEYQCEWHRITRMTGPDCGEPLFATPCCNSTSRATWSTPSEPPHMNPFLKSCGFRLWSRLLLSTCLKKMNLLCFISVCLYPKRAGWRTRTFVVVFGFSPGWLLLSTCLF